MFIVKRPHHSKLQSSETETGHILRSYGAGKTFKRILCYKYFIPTGFKSRSHFEVSIKIISCTVGPLA